jgi:D-xylose 1-dehydrogenase (NADP+, D-xylono-1,5-lactone-forming)
VTSTLRWGLMSTARINRAVIDGAARSDRAEIVAVGGRDGARTQAYARANGIDRAHASYDGLLADPEVDAVYISLPNGLHVEWSIRALEAGKHVLCEKPFSPHPEDVEEAFAVAERAGLVLSEAFMWRHHPQTHELLRLVRDDGAVGPVRVVRAVFSFVLENTADIRLDPELEGGALMDVGCYCVSAIRAIAGEPLSLSGEETLGPSGVDVVFAGTARCPDGVLAHFDCGFVLPHRAGIEVVGEDGVIAVPRPWHPKEPLIEVRRGGDVERIEPPRANSYQLQLENIADAVSGAAPLLLSRDDAVGQARAIEALYRSAGS